MTKKKIKELFQAIEDRDVNVVKQIIGGDPDALEATGCGKQSFDGKTPLMYALQCGHTDLAVFLLESHANVNATMAESWRWPALHFAVRAAASGVGKPADTDVLKRMLSLGADPNATDAFGNTALDRALMDYDKGSDHWVVIQILLDGGANRENRGASKMTARELVSTNIQCFAPKVRSLMGLAVSAANCAPPVPYSSDANFELEERIVHKVFGDVVVSSVSETWIEVALSDGTKKRLAHRP